MITVLERNTKYAGSTRKLASEQFDAEIVAVVVHDSTEYLPGDFEGPPNKVRWLEDVVRYAVGRVVGTVVRVERIMSDVWADVTYAVVWDGEDGFYETSVYNSEFGAVGLDELGFHILEVDAPDGIKAYYECWKAMKEEEARVAAEKARVAREAERAAAAAKEPRKGRKIKVVRGRKVPVGTVGECIWVGHGDYGLRVGLKTTDGTVHWTAAKNVEAVAA